VIEGFMLLIGSMVVFLLLIQGFFDGFGFLRDQVKKDVNSE